MPQKELKSYKRRYPVYDLELAFMVFALKMWQYYSIESSLIWVQNTRVGVPQDTKISKYESTQVGGIPRKVQLLFFLPIG